MCNKNTTYDTAAEYSHSVTFTHTLSLFHWLSLSRQLQNSTLDGLPKVRTSFRQNIVFVLYYTQILRTVDVGA